VVEQPITWFIVFYIIFVAINIRGIVATMRFSVVICFLSLGILAFFFISVLVSGKFNRASWSTSRPQAATHLPAFGFAGIFPRSVAIWFYLAIEELPLAAEESTTQARRPRRPLGITTLVITGALTFLLTAESTAARSPSGFRHALFDGFKAVYGDNTGAASSLFGLIGLIASSSRSSTHTDATPTRFRAQATSRTSCLSHTHAQDSAYRAHRGGVVGLALAILVYQLA